MLAFHFPSPIRYRFQIYILDHMRQTPFLLERPNDRAIHGCWHLPDGEAKGTILFLHGYKGYMDWGCWRMLGTQCAAVGWRFLRINFTHNGTTPQHPSEFVDLEGFAANTYRRELEEAVTVLRALRTEGAQGDQTTREQPLAVIGHSRGGGIACLAAHEADQALKTQGKRGVDVLITWAAVADFAARFPAEAERDAWRKTGTREVINHRTRQRLWHNWDFYQDFEAHAHRLNIERAVSAYPGKTLIAHGDDDTAVPIDHARSLASWAQNGTLFIGEGAGHTFGAKEPWTAPTLPPAMEALTQTTLRFLEEGRAVR